MKIRAGMLVVALAGAVIGLLFLGSREEGVPTLVHKPTAAYPKFLRLTRPVDLATGHGSLWLLRCKQRCAGDGRQSRGEVVRLDEDRGRVLSRVEVSDPGALAVGEGGVWVANFWGSSLERIDPASGQVVATIELSLPRPIARGDDAFVPQDVAVGEKRAWVSTARGYVARIDPANNRVEAMIKVPSKAAGPIAAGDGAVWLGESMGVLRVDPRSGQQRLISITGPGRRTLSANSLALQRGSLWVAGLWAIDNTFPRRDQPAVAKIRTDTSEIGRIRSLSPGRSAAVAATTRAAVWLSGVESPIVYRLDQRSGRITSRRVRGPHPLIGVAGRKVWIATRGGELRRLR